MTSLAKQLISNKITLGLVGLGYVGLPIAASFAKKGVQVLGFDIDDKKISELKQGKDRTNEISTEQLNKISSHIKFTNNPIELSNCKIIIVAVPTPINHQKQPDLTPLIRASQCIGENIKKGTYVIYESTVYPGVTEETCIPVIENNSNLSWKNGDFFVGYSPERINPGDTEHTLEKIVKIVSGQNDETCNEIAKIYEIVIEAGVHQAESIKVAEAAKVIENTQRDLNIALMNELSLIFNKMGLNTKAILEAAGTKWNFLKFHPGLVGGHCIGVDPYYLTSKAEQLGYHPEVVLAGRKINDNMANHIAQQTVKEMIKTGKKIKDASALILGLTFKENVPDFRNSKTFDIIKELNSYGINISVSDPYIKNLPDEIQNQYNFTPIELAKAENYDVVIVATPHQEFKKITVSQLKSFYSEDTERPIVIDIRWMFDKRELEKEGFTYWSL